MALGARRADILALIFSDSLTPTLLGILLGLVGAYALTRVLNSLLLGVSSTNPFTIAAVTLSSASRPYLPVASPRSAPPASIPSRLCGTNNI